MTTKESINLALKIIGARGLDGISVQSMTAKEGLAMLLGAAPADRLSTARLLTELKRQNLIEVAKIGDKFQFTISLAGAYRLEKLLVGDLTIDTATKWNGKWYAVTFNVPLNRSRQRTIFTNRLSKLGLYKLQKGLWLYPYPIIEVVSKMASYYNLLRYCHFFEISQMDKLTLNKLTNNYGDLVKISVQK